MFCMMFKTMEGTIVSVLCVWGIHYIPVDDQLMGGARVSADLHHGFNGVH